LLAILLASAPKLVAAQWQGTTLDPTLRQADYRLSANQTQMIKFVAPERV
jgi:hypothetical protein